jgi:hypothetical protein
VVQEPEVKLCELLHWVRSLLFRVNVDRFLIVRGIVIWSSLIINRHETEVSHAGLSITRIEEEDREWFNATILEGGT